MAGDGEKELLSSIVSDINTYSGDDPIRPWLKGIKRMEESLTRNVLRAKIPRFLQRCAQEFDADRRYRNDRRYVAVWIMLMDYVDDARVILRKMEKKKIGLKRASFYIAYAIYYEKRKKFVDAEKMYHVGIQNLAEPSSELQKSFERFLNRMNLYTQRKAEVQKMMLATGKSTSRITEKIDVEVTVNNSLKGVKKGKSMSKSGENTGGSNNSTKEGYLAAKKEGYHDENLKQSMVCKDDTVVVKFVDSAIVGRPYAEDASHHGLVDPTINMMDAMKDISNMFKEPLESEMIVRRKLKRSKPKENQKLDIIEIFEDKDLEEKNDLFEHKVRGDVGEHCVIKNQESSVDGIKAVCKPFAGAFKVYVDDDDKCADEGLNKCQEYCNHREDAIVENACHHGLVDPTINMKEAMDDINSMFGEPLDFVRSTETRNPRKLLVQKPSSHKLTILLDEDLKGASEDSSMDQTLEYPGICILADTKENSVSSIGSEDGLSDPTVFTKEALDDINAMFAEPLDF